MAIGDIIKSGASFSNLSQLTVSAMSCRVKVKGRKKQCKCPTKSSFPAGNEVLTASGKVAIEALRADDMVAAPNEETGASRTFPITGVSARQANDLPWLHLEREDGATSRMGVTTGHPMFVAGQGWIAAGELIPSDIIRNADLSDLAVLAIEVGDMTQRVHNLEIGEAHTYFAGELEAWGHNSC